MLSYVLPMQLPIFIIIIFFFFFFVACASNIAVKFIILAQLS